MSGDPVTEVARYANGRFLKLWRVQKKTLKDLYPFFDEANDVIDNWIAEGEKVPGDAQRVISAWLEQPVRNLFSDLRSSTKTVSKSKK